AEPAGNDRHAHQAGPVPGHEADVLGRYQLGRDDQVALVLAILVVDHDHELAGLEVGDRLRNGGQGHGHQILLAQVSSHVPGYEVGFEVDHGAAPVEPGDGDFNRVRDQGHPEGSRRFVDPRHRKTHAVD